jgi:hypothetical protein
VVDDILDITATTEELGKTAGKDLASDKTTYPSLVGLERSREVWSARQSWGWGRGGSRVLGSSGRRGQQGARGVGEGSRSSWRSGWCGSGHWRRAQGSGRAGPRLRACLIYGSAAAPLSACVPAQLWIVAACEQRCPAASASGWPSKHHVRHRTCPPVPCLQIADELIEEARAALSPFDPERAAPLHALAEYIRSRKN